MYEWQWSASGVVFSFLAEGEAAESLFHYIKGASPTNYSSLENLKDNIARQDEFSGIEFCFCILGESSFFALVGGGASLYVVRGGEVYPLLRTLKGTSSLISGNAKEGDRFELETSSNRKIFPEEDKEEFQEQPFVPNPPQKSRSLKLKLAGAIDSILARLPERKIVVHGEEDGVHKRSRKASLIGVVLLLILGVSIYFGVKQRGEKIKRQEYEPQLTQAQHDLQEAISLSSLSQDRARQLILTSKNEAEDLKNKGVEDDRLDSLLSDINDHLGGIAGIYDEPAEVYLDLSIISSGFEASDLSFSEGVLRVLDTKSKKLAGIETDTKRTSIIAGPDYLPDAKATIAYADRSFILSSDGIREVTSSPDLVIKPDGWDPDNVLVYAFAGNMYVLDKSGNQIWRYQGVRGGFLEKEAWLGSGFNRDTSNADFMAIDGSIWTVSKNGDFSVYSLGAPATFSITGETSPLGEISGFFTDEESKFIYLLDKTNSRIAVIKKNGEYVSEYDAPELADATDLVVDEKNGIILFLANSKLYKLDAKHLGDVSNESSQ